MKRTLFVLLFSILLLSMLGISNGCIQGGKLNSSPADSGFDADYGGGSWDGGGSYGDDSYSSNYNSNGSFGGSVDSEYIPLILFFSIGTCVIIIASRCYIEAESKRKFVKKQIEDKLSIYYDLQPGDGNDSELIKLIYSNYVDIQKAWMNRDLSSVRHLLTDEIYNMYQMQIETLIEDNQRNVMSNFEFVCGGIKFKRTTNNVETIKVILCVNCKDYIEDISKNKVVNGDKKATITYIYELTFIRDVKASKTINCPMCGAKVKNQMSATCPYCNNSLLLTAFNFTMSNKLILHQFKRK